MKVEKNSPVKLKSKKITNGKDSRADLLNEQLRQAETNYEKLKKELDMLKLHQKELEETNEHLITATFRERDLRKQLVKTLDELNRTKAVVEDQNKRIVESINYSKKIQVAINATEEDISNAGIPDSFILYRPKDVISGDFPWFFRKGDYLYIAAVDCTGHGVPGAMMSMIGNLILNSIMNNNKILPPGEVLDDLHRFVVSTLKQDAEGSNSSDGMDAALCRINIKTKEMVFSGAHRPLYYISNKGELEEVKGDRFPIGGTQYDRKRKPFVNHTVNYKKGDSFFIFSDGLPDQLGGPDTKKLMIGRVEDMLLEHHGKKMSAMKKEINKAFNDWKGDFKQVDDVLLIGMKMD